MADETNMPNDTATLLPISESVVPETRKKRGPRAKGASSATMSGEPAPAKRGRRARAASAKPIIAEATSAAKKVRKARTPKSPNPVETASASAIDEMADLLQLEEENQKLRKLLSEKLRAENADLRKRLGLA